MTPPRSTRSQSRTPSLRAVGRPSAVGRREALQDFGPGRRAERLRIARPVPKRRIVGRMTLPKLEPPAHRGNEDGGARIGFAPNLQVSLPLIARVVRHCEYAEGPQHRARPFEHSNRVVARRGFAELSGELLPGSGTCRHCLGGRRPHERPRGLRARVLEQRWELSGDLHQRLADPRAQRYCGGNVISLHRHTEASTHAGLGWTCWPRRYGSAGLYISLTCSP